MLYLTALQVDAVYVCIDVYIHASGVDSYGAKVNFEMSRYSYLLTVLDTRHNQMMCVCNRNTHVLCLSGKMPAN